MNEFAITLIGLLALIFLIVAFLTILKPAGFLNKGKQGEKMVAKKLGKTIVGERYVFNDVLFEINGSSCQIDHILVDKSGIYIFETKNYNGTIYGTLENKQWTQSLNFGKTTNSFYNPIKQNLTHVYKLKSLLKKKYPIYAYTVFVQNNAPLAQGAINLLDLKDYLLSNYTALSAQDLEFVSNKIQEAMDTCSISLSQHVDNIHNKRKCIEQGICPRCGGNLVERNGKYGKFYGCSNFPKCTFKMNVQDEEDCA